MSKVQSIYDTYKGTSTTKLDNVMQILKDQNRVFDMDIHNSYNGDRTVVIKCKAISDLSVLSSALIDYGMFIYALNIHDDYYKIHLKDLPK